jgi:NAD(P)-dependent dehydrogenase (short-subunit alcohol dehydrogenase family)
MLMSVAEIARNAGMYPELAGARVLITGVQATRGVDLVRAFGDHGCRMVLQIPEISAEIDALLGHVAQTALDIHVHHDPIEKAEDAVQFTQSAVKYFGGFDIVINLIAFDTGDLNSAATLEELEDLISERFQAATRTTGVTANRMGLTWTYGSVLNILRISEPRSAGEAAVSGMARTALVALTRGEARKWAGQSVRINGVAPRAVLGARLDFEGDDDCVRSEPDVAALALYLAGQDGENLTGMVFDAEGTASAY